MLYILLVCVCVCAFRLRISCIIHDAALYPINLCNIEIVGNVMPVT